MRTKSVASIGFLKSPAFHGLKPKLLLTFLILATLVGSSCAQKKINHAYGFTHEFYGLF
mgnify:CR=1 FL=1